MKQLKYITMDNKHKVGYRFKIRYGSGIEDAKIVGIYKYSGKIYYGWKWWIGWGVGWSSENLNTQDWLREREVEIIDEE